MRKYLWKLVGLLLFNIPTLSAQQLNYQSSAIGNEEFKCAGKHMQNHIFKMVVEPNGKCVTYSEWDEGGHPNGVYKDGTYIGSASYNPNNRAAKDKNGNTWTIMNYYARFLVQLSCPGGIGCQGEAAKAYNKWVQPVPTGSAAPYIKCSDGREIRDVVDPSAIGINYKTGELLVYENSEDQYVKVYNVSGTPALVKTFGVKGGVWAGPEPGRMDDPLKFAGATGIGADSTGVIYIALSGVNAWGGAGGGSEIRAFNENASLKWRMRGQIFLASGVVDPSSNGTDIYTSFYHFKMDYSKPAGQNWEAYAFTINPFKYPDDPRLVCNMEDGFALKIINGIKYLWITDMYNNGVAVYRFDGETAVPCAAFCAAYGWNGDEYGRFIWHWNMNRPGMPRWLWNDRNGNGKGEENEFESYNIGQFCDALDVDNEGNFYLGAANSNVYKFPVNTFDSYGNPQYSAATMKIFANVGHELHSMKWIEENDMFVCGNGTSISQLDVYKDWSKPTRKKLYTVSIPQHQPSQIGDACQVSADKDYFYITYSARGGPKTGKEGEISVYNLKDGSYVGYISPGPEIGSCSGMIDMSTPTKAFVSYSGERIIITEEDWVGKVIVYNWCPDGECDLQCTKQVDSVSLASSLIIDGFKTDTLVATVLPDTVCYTSVSWTSLNTKVATVDRFGIVNAVCNGTAWIKATSVQQPDKQDSCLVTVSKVLVTGITFISDTVEVSVSKSVKLNIDFVPANAINRKITWLSSDNSVATVDSLGVVTAIKTGIVKITAISDDGGFQDTCIIKAVAISVKSINFNPDKAGVWINDNTTIKPVILPSDANNQNLNWISLDPAIASVDQAGIVSGLTLGTVGIVAVTQDGGFADTCFISVLAANQFTSKDIGIVCVSGSLKVVDNVYTMTAGGADIYNVVDGFHFAYHKQLGDGVMIARVKGITATSVWAKAGVMMRETLDPGSKHAIMVITPSFGSSFQRRTITAKESENTTPGDSKQAPYWVKMTRKGDILSGFKSPDGFTWTKVGESTIAMNNSIYVGLCLTSHNDCQLNTAIFDHVIFTSNVDTVINTSAIYENQLKSFEIYPNPFHSGSLSIKLPEDSKQLSIFDITGKLIYQRRVIKNKYNIDSSLFTSRGVYVVNVLTSSNSLNKKVIITK